MVSVEEEGNVLIFRDVPAGYWIQAAIILILLSGCLIAWWPDLLHGKVSVLSWVIIAAFLAGIANSLRVPTIETQFDRDLRKVFIYKRSVFRKLYHEYRFEDIQGGALVREYYDRRGNPQHWVELLAREGKPVRLMTPDGTRDNVVRAAVPRINEYLGTEISSDDFQLTQLED